MVKAAEEASLAQSLSAAQEHRALAQRILEDAQATVRKRIDALNEADARSREPGMRAGAQKAGRSGPAYL